MVSFTTKTEATVSVSCSWFSSTHFGNPVHQNTEDGSKQRFLAFPYWDEWGGETLATAILNDIPSSSRRLTDAGQPTLKRDLHLLEAMMEPDESHPEVVGMLDKISELARG